MLYFESCRFRCQWTVWPSWRGSAGDDRKEAKSHPASPSFRFTAGQERTITVAIINNNSTQLLTASRIPQIQSKFVQFYCFGDNTRASGASQSC